VPTFWGGAGKSDGAFSEKKKNEGKGGLWVGGVLEKRVAMSKTMGNRERQKGGGFPKASGKRKAFQRVGVMR